MGKRELMVPIKQDQHTMFSDIFTVYKQSVTDSFNCSVHIMIECDSLFSFQLTLMFYTRQTLDLDKVPVVSCF